LSRDLEEGFHKTCTFPYKTNSSLVFIPDLDRDANTTRACWQFKLV